MNWIVPATIGIACGALLRHFLPIVIFEEIIKSILGRSNPLDPHHVINSKSEYHWFNLGYWQPATKDYHEAAENLANRLAKAAELNAKDQVLDLGSGCGDQLVLWAEKYNVKSITAFEPDMNSYLTAKVKCQPYPEISLLNKEPIPFNRKFSKIIALDCAYLFKNKTNMWKQSLGSLKPEGKLVFNDLTLSLQCQTFWTSMFLRFVSLITKIPYREWRTRIRYEEVLSSIGFINVEWELQTEEVIHGFSNYVLNFMEPSSLFKPTSSIKIKMTALILRFLHRRRLVEYWMISASN